MKLRPGYLRLGYNNGDPIELTLAERRQGTYIIGTTGTGKSTLLKNIVYQDMRDSSGGEKHGLCVLDPHGDLIDEMLELKSKGDLRGVIVSGCLAERQRETLLQDRPEIDHLVGVFGREEVTKVADRLIGGLEEQRTVFQPAPSRPLPDTSRMRVTPRHFAFLKISEGCDRLCTFCARSSEALSQGPSDSSGPRQPQHSQREIVD